MISPPSFPSAVLAIIFIARRIQPFLSLVDREVESSRALHGSALENRRKWYSLGVTRFFKRCGIWYLMVR